MTADNRRSLVVERELFDLVSNAICSLFCFKPLSSLSQALAILWIKERPLPIYSRAFSFPQRDVVSTWDGLVRNDPVIPERNSTRRPLPADREVIRIKKMLAEEGKDVVRFLPVEFLNALNEIWVVVQGFNISNRMSSNLFSFELVGLVGKVYGKQDIKSLTSGCAVAMGARCGVPPPLIEA